MSADIKTVLTDAQKDSIYNAWRDQGNDVSYGDLIDSVESAVLAASAPAQEPVAVLELKKCRGPRKFQFRLLGDFFPEKETPLYAAPVDAQDAVDAKRYRKLRATTKAIRNDEGTERIEVTPEDFDKHVDAMQASQSPVQASDAGRQG